MANVVNPYDQAAWSTYTPLTSQEILMPAMMMREKHDKLDEEYAAIDNDLQKVAFIVENETDPVLKQKYSSYMNDLISNRDELMSRGLTNTSRRNMLNLRGRFQSEIQPINLGYQMKLQDINTYNQIRAKDPTYLAPDPSQRSVMDYINNGLQPMTQQGISGAMLTKQAEDYLRPFSQELSSEPQLRAVLEQIVGEEKIPQYMDYIKTYGYKPGTEGHKVLMQAAREKVLGSSGISSWGNEEQLKRANYFIDLAETATIGKEDARLVDNNRYVTALQRQQAKEAAMGNQQNYNPYYYPETDLGIEENYGNFKSKEDEQQWLDSLSLDSNGNIISSENKELQQNALKYKKEADDFYNKNKDRLKLLLEYQEISKNKTEEEKRHPQLPNMRGQSYLKEKGIGVTTSRGIDLGYKDRALLDKYNSLKRVAETQGATFNSSLKDTEELVNKYDYLGSNKLEAVKTGYALDKSTSRIFNSVRDVNTGNNDLKDKIIGDISLAKSQGNTRLYEIKDNNIGNPSSSPASINDKDWETFNKPDNIDIKFSRNGLIVHNRALGKTYALDTGGVETSKVNKALKDSHTRLLDFTNKSIKKDKLIPINQVTPERIINEGETIVNNPNITVKALNTIDPNNPNNPIKQILIADNKGNMSIEYIDAKDVIMGGGNAKRILDNISKIAISSMVESSYKNPVPSGTLQDKKPKTYGYEY